MPPVEGAGLAERLLEDIAEEGQSPSSGTEENHQHLLHPRHPRHSAGSPTHVALGSDGKPLRSFSTELKAAGYYHQFLEYRDGYRKWRLGDADGATGDVTAEQLEAKAKKSTFQYYYPDSVAFKFRETVSYWIMLLFFEGSLLFTFAYGLVIYHWDSHPRFRGIIPERPNFGGAVCFTIGAYLGYFEVINIGIKLDEPVVYVWLREFRKWRDSHDLELDSVVGTLSYFIGAMIFNVPCIEPFLPDSLCGLEAREAYLVMWPSIIGSVFFVAGGLMELIHNKIWRTRPNKAVWWVAVCDFLGSLLFLVSSFPADMIGGPYWVHMGYFAGSVCFAVASAAGLAMWNCGEYGLGLLRQLNLVARCEHEDGLQLGVASDGATVAHHTISETDVIGEPVKQPFSYRRFIFLMIYATCGTIAILNLCINQGNSELLAWEVSIELHQVVTAIIIHLVLALHSSGMSRMPKDQPHRCLMYLTRITALIMLANCTLDSWYFLCEKSRIGASVEKCSFDLNQYFKTVDLET